jgi:hypothetical protein
MAWALDKKTPLLTLLLAVGLHGCVIVWWASSLSTRVDAHDAKLVNIEVARFENRERIVRIEQLAVDIQANVNRLLLVNSRKAQLDNH